MWSDKGHKGQASNMCLLKKKKKNLRASTRHSALISGPPCRPVDVMYALQR